MKSHTRICLVTLLLIFISLMLFVRPAQRTVSAEAQPQQTSAQPLVARITIKSEREMQRVVTLGLDLLEMRDGDDLFAVMSEAEFTKLAREGWRIRVDEEQTATLREQTGSNNLFRDGYRTVPEIRAYVDALAARWPNHVEVITYGQSWEKVSSGGTAGHDLFAVKLTNRQRPGVKPTILITASVHARELVPTEIALRLMEYLLNNYGVDGDVSWLLDDHLIVIVPVANPDGRRLAEQSLMQRKNMNTSYGGGCSVPPTSTNQFGVDLNRNFNFKWGTVNTPSEPKCGQTYPGPSAASEPEVAALQNLKATLFTDQRGPLDTDPAPQTTTGVFIDLHSTGNLVMWAWAHNSTVPPNGADLELLGRKLAAYNAHTPQQAIDLYPSSGSTRDYSYGVFGIASYTFEIGPGSGGCGGFMPPFNCLDSGSDGRFWPRQLPALLYAAKVARAPYQQSKGPTPETASAVLTLPQPRIYALRAQFSEQFNGGQNITAAEYYIDTPPWRGGTPAPMTALDGSFDSPNEVAVALVQPIQTSEPFYVRARDASGNWGAVRAISQTIAQRPNTTDFDGDARTNIAVWRPSNGTWYVSQTGGTFNAQAWGTSGDRIVPGDYDGDGKADIAVFRPSNGYWYIFESQTNTLRAEAWGIAEDLPAPGDYDGDGRVDVAVFRPSVGTWYILQSSDRTLVSRQFGVSVDKPVPGDYDRDGKTDIAVYRPGQSAGAPSAWYVLQSADNSLKAQGWGVGGDRAVPGDYDGDRKIDFAVFRPADGNWHIIQSSSNIYRAQGWGIAGDVPVPGDYDADGKTDTAIWRPSNSTWYALRSSSGELTVQVWGATGDVPAPSAYIP